MSSDSESSSTFVDLIHALIHAHKASFYFVMNEIVFIHVCIIYGLLETCFKLIGR